MKLYKVALAPNPRKVMLYIAEREQLGTQMGIEQITVNTVKGHQRQPEHLARNPFGTLPALELDDGSFIVESLAVIHYLEDKFRRQSIKVQIQGAQILSDDMYFSYFEKTKDAAQRRSWTFYKAIKD